MTIDFEDFQIRLSLAIGRTYQRWTNHFHIVETCNEVAQEFFKALQPLVKDSKNPAVKRWVKGFLAKGHDGSACAFCGTPIHKTITEHARLFTAVSLIPISLGGKIQSDNFVLSCFKCASDLGEQDWLAWGKAKSETMRQQLLAQREEVLMTSDNHVISFDLYRDWRTSKAKCRGHLKSRWSHVRFTVYASVVEKGGLVAVDKSSISPSLLYLFRQLTVQHGGVEVNHIRFLTFAFSRVEALQVIQALVELNGLVRKVNLPFPYFAFQSLTLSEHDRRWGVWLSGYDWIDDVYHHLRETKLIADFNKKKGEV
ncbi:MAG: hypothetical protein WA056_02210 [Gallionella sp.]